MPIVYAKKQTAMQKNETSAASSFLDASSQGKALQRKADLVNNSAQQAENPRPSNGGVLQFALGDGLDEDDVEIVEVIPEPKYETQSTPVDPPKCHILYYENGEVGDYHIEKDAGLAERRRAKKKKVVKSGLFDAPESPVSEKDDIVILSHGRRFDEKVTSLDEKSQNMFADERAENLAYLIFQRISSHSRGFCTYQGEIFLDGCYTGEPLKNLHDGTSYAERFGEALKDFIVNMNTGVANSRRKSGFLSTFLLGKTFTVKGNLGGIMTDSRGHELVELDRRNRAFFIENADDSKHPKAARKAAKKKDGLSYPGSIGKVKYKFEY